jgi:hypothetical protein
MRVSRSVLREAGGEIPPAYSPEPMRKQVEAWQRSEITDVTAKVVIYEAFVEGKLEAPRHLARAVHDLYFEPKYEEFRSRTIWSLSNAFTSAFKELEPIPQFRATAATFTLQIWEGLPTTRVLIIGQSRCLRHEVILFRDARGPRSRNPVMFDGGFVIAHPFK